MLKGKETSIPNHRWKTTGVILPGALLVLAVWAAQVAAAPRAELWARWQRHDATSARSVDHSAWDTFLGAYVVDEHPSGINRVRYGVVTATGRSRLRAYLERMQAIPVSELGRDEQLAYWINLYNAATVDVVLEHFPVPTIRDINLSSSFFSRLLGGGPWQATLLTVEGEHLSLDDIEHRILRPIWRDSRLHYALNCASLGCPNLQTEAFTAKNTQRLLNEGASAYINHPRGVSFRDGGLRLSKIYDWFQEDFGNSTRGVLAHLGQHAQPGLKERLEQYDGVVGYDYDWSLNDVPIEGKQNPLTHGATTIGGDTP